jgi:hypothetical protein
MQFVGHFQTNMWLKLFRTTFQCLAFGIFLFQMQGAVRKYMSKPLIKEHSKGSLEDIQKPLIYLCQDNQFSYSKAADLGYSLYSQYLVGNSSKSDTLTWVGGNSSDQTYDEIEKELYAYNYTDLTIEYATLKHVAIHPYGFCKQVTNFSMNDPLKITSKNTVKFLILNPYRSSNLRADEILGITHILEAKENLYDYNQYRMTYKLFDDTMHEGETCTDYQKDNTSFGECLEMDVKQKLTAMYGCLPQWYPENIEKCNGTSIKWKPDINQYVSNIAGSQEIETNCKPPCHTLQMDFQRVSYRSNFPLYAVLNLKHDPVVHILKTVCSYNVFSLIVELGSALGLWLGMSAVGLLDIIIENWIGIHQAIAKKTRTIKDN